MRGAGSAQERRRQFHRRPEATRKPRARAAPPKATCAPAGTPRGPAPPPCQRPGGGRTQGTCHRGGGGALAYVPCSGVHRGRSGQPQTRCLLRGASCETGRGCRAPQHPWVRRKNKPQHPLLSGLNNRWPLVVSFYQREGSKAAGLLFVASLESSLSRQRPRENKPAPGAPSRG